MAPPPTRDEDDLDDLLADEPWKRPVHKPAGRRAPRRAAERPEAVRAWRASDEPEPAEDDELDFGEKPVKTRPPVFWRARDSLYFEPLVAVAILAVLLVSLFAYTSNWPPVYVVESNSMQHGAGDHLGVLNAGDIILAQKASYASIVTYVEGSRTGFSTYGEYGDVLLYYPNGSTKVTPIVHRAIIYLEYDATKNAYNATGLTGLPCGNTTGSFYATPGTTHDCGTTDLTGDLYLNDIGGRSVSLDLARVADLGKHSGYITLGDNNSLPDQLPSVGLAPLSGLVEPAWVIGVARGMVPWFGAIKLLLDGNAGRVPDASWEFMGLTIAGVIFAAAGIHLLFRRRGEERPHGRRRRDARDDSLDEEEDGDEAPPPRSRPTVGGGVRSWQAPARGAAEVEEEPASAPRRGSHEQRRRAHFTSGRDTNPDRRHRTERRGSDDDADDES